MAGEITHFDINTYAQWEEADIYTIVFRTPVRVTDKVLPKDIVNSGGLTPITNNSPSLVEIGLGDGNTNSSHGRNNGVYLKFDKDVTFNSDAIELTVYMGNLLDTNQGDIRTAHTFKYKRIDTGDNKVIWLNDRNAFKLLTGEWSGMQSLVFSIADSSQWIDVRQISHDNMWQWDYHGVTPLEVPNANFNILNYNTYEELPQNSDYSTTHAHMYNESIILEEWYFDVIIDGSSSEADKKLNSIIAQHNGDLSKLRVKMDTSVRLSKVEHGPKLLYISSKQIGALYYKSTTVKTVGDIIAPYVTSFESLFNGTRALTSVGQIMAPKCTNITSMFEASSVTHLRDDFMKHASVVSKGSKFANSSKLEVIPRCIGEMTLTTAYMMFARSKITEVPDWIFEHSKLENIDQCFTQCKNLIRIGSKVFQGWNSAGKEVGIQRIFYGSDNLEEIPEGLFNPFTNVRSLMETFAYCRKLRTIPATLFDKMTRLKTLQHTFSQTNIQTIPNGLFDKLINLTDVAATFSYSKVNTIPENLFKYNTSLREVTGLFTNCPITTVPPNLFKYCLSTLVYAANLFKNTNITSLPNTLLQNARSLENISSIVYETKIASIPTDFLNGCSSIRKVESAFAMCVNLTTVDENLFNSCNLTLDSVKRCFFRSTNITGKLPEVWDKGRFPKLVYKFEYAYGCTKASNYADIPDDYK